MRDLARIIGELIDQSNEEQPETNATEADNKLISPVKAGVY